MPDSSPLADEAEVIVVGAGPAGSACAGTLAYRQPSPGYRRPDACV